MKERPPRHKVHLPREECGDQQRVQEALMVRRQQEASVAGDVLRPERPKAPERQSHQTDHPLADPPPPARHGSPTAASILSTTSSRVKPDVSIRIAPDGTTSAPTGRDRSSASRRSIPERMASTSPPCSAARRFARTSGLASR